MRSYTVGPRRQRIRDAVAEEPEREFTFGDLAALVGGSRTALTVMLGKMVRADEIVRVRWGVYRSAPPGAAPPPPPRVRSARWRRSTSGQPRARTIAPLVIARDVAAARMPSVDDVDRPLARAECLNTERPCPFVACKHHLYLDVNPETGSIKLNFPDLEVWDMKETCSLDVADRGGITLEEVGAILNLTRERIRQVEVRGLLKLKLEGEIDGSKDLVMLDLLAQVPRR